MVSILMYLGRIQILLLADNNFPELTSGYERLGFHSNHTNYSNDAQKTQTLEVLAALLIYKLSFGATEGDIMSAA